MNFNCQRCERPTDMFIESYDPSKKKLRTVYLCPEHMHDANSILEVFVKGLIDVKKVEE